MPEPYTTGQVAKLAGVSLKQLQFWDETKLIKPSIKHGFGGCGGNMRYYSEQQLAEVKVVAALRRKGVSLQLIRPAMAKLRRIIATGGPFWLVVILQPNLHCWAYSNAESLVEFVAACRHPVYVVRVK